MYNKKTLAVYDKKKSALFPYFYNKEGSRPWSFVGGGKGAVMLFLYILRETQIATFADPSNSTIYRQSYITMRAASTKIPHLLCEKTYLKPRI